MTGGDGSIPVSAPRHRPSKGAGRWEELRCGERRFVVYTPPGRAPWRGAPLVVLLHGCRQDPTAIAVTSRITGHADRTRGVVVMPYQTRADNRWCCWNWFLPAHQRRGAGEPAAIAAIVDAVVGGASPWRIDARRVYAAGLSAGGAMASVLGATYPDRFAAIGVHSGLGYGAAVGATGAYLAMRSGSTDDVRQSNAALLAMGERARVVPVVVVQGSEDRTVHPRNGVQTVRQWMETNRAASAGRYDARFDDPAETIATDGARPTTVRRWVDRRGVVVQELHEVAGLAHAWSGGSSAGSFADPAGPDATANMLQFFARHCL